MKKRPAAADVHHSCRCRATQTVAKVPARIAGTHLRCYCADCQTAACLHDPQQDLLLPTGASDIWHTTPDHLTILEGTENLRIYRLSPRGGFRWYASCCGSLMFSTLKNMSIPFVSLPLRLDEQAEAADVLGPVQCHAFIESARPHPDSPRNSIGMRLAGTRMLTRAITAWLSGRAAKSPLKQPDGAPIAPVEVSTLAARKAARPSHLR